MGTKITLEIFDLPCGCKYAPMKHGDTVIKTCPEHNKYLILAQELPKLITGEKFTLQTNLDNSISVLRKGSEKPVETIFPGQSTILVINYGKGYVYLDLANTLYTTTQSSSNQTWSGSWYV